VIRRHPSVRRKLLGYRDRPFVRYGRTVTTVRLTSSKLRAHSRTSGVLRFLCLVAFLFALLYTHSLSAESAAHHSSGHGAETISAPENVTNPGDRLSPDDASTWHLASNQGDDFAAEAEHCMAVQPAPGLDLPVLCESPFHAVTPRLTSSDLAIARASASVVDSRQSIVSAVLRI